MDMFCDPIQQKRCAMSVMASNSTFETQSPSPYAEPGRASRSPAPASFGLPTRVTNHYCSPNPELSSSSSYTFNSFFFLCASKKIKLGGVSSMLSILRIVIYLHLSPDTGTIVETFARHRGVDCLRVIGSLPDLLDLFRSSC